MRPALLAELPPPRESRCVCFVAREEAYSLHGNGKREGGGLKESVEESWLKRELAGLHEKLSQPFKLF